MKTIILIFLILTGNEIVAQDTGDLHVVVHNIKHTSGVIHIALFNKEDGFLEDAFLIKTIQISDKGDATTTFDSIPYGKYGLSIFHDLNENLELDTNFIGVPKEPFGFSNDVMGAFGPPSFDKAAVLVKDSTQTTHIKLKSF